MAADAAMAEARGWPRARRWPGASDGLGVIRRPRWAMAGRAGDGRGRARSKT